MHPPTTSRRRPTVTRAEPGKARQRWGWLRVWSRAVGGGSRRRCARRWASGSLCSPWPCVLLGLPLRRVGPSGFVFARVAVALRCRAGGTGFLGVAGCRVRVFSWGGALRLRRGRSGWLVLVVSCPCGVGPCLLRSRACGGACPSRVGLSPLRVGAVASWCRHGVHAGLVWLSTLDRPARRGSVALTRRPRHDDPRPSPALSHANPTSHPTARHHKRARPRAGAGRSPHRERQAREPHHPRRTQ